MLDLLVAQVRRLFSSKSNRGRLVYKTTDRLHDYKQVLLAISIALLLGYSQFRENFDCMGVRNVDRKWLKHICWTNGTTTLNTKSRNEQDEAALPHIGIHFRFRGGRYHSINHNYMRSLWFLLLLMALCSYVAQRHWASIFQHDTLIALLKLPGHDELPGAKKNDPPITSVVNATGGPENQANPNSSAPKTKEENLRNNILLSQMKTSASQPATSEPFKLPTSASTEHIKSLDYYVEQLLSLLVFRRSASFRLLELKLKQKLVIHSLYSSLLTSMQFVLPWFFIGNHYLLYGWNYSKHWLRYTLHMLKGDHVDTNTVDYKLSSEIWPTMARCDFSMNGEHKVEHSTAYCSIPINEICGKLFAVIWWLVAINIVIELCSLLLLLVCSFNLPTLRWSFGIRFWPECRHQARILAASRGWRSAFRGTRLEPPKVAHFDPLGCHRKRTSSSGSQPQPNDHSPLDDRERKLLEAQSEGRASSNCIRPGKWYLWCSRDVGLFLAEKGKQFGKGSSEALSQRRRRRDERREESYNVYLLLYLLHLRLGCSRRKTEHVIRVTTASLNALADKLRELDMLNQSSAVPGKLSSSSTTTTTTTDENRTQQVARLEQHQQQQQPPKQQPQKDDNNDDYYDDDDDYEQTIGDASP